MLEVDPCILIEIVDALHNKGYLPDEITSENLIYQAIIDYQYDNNLKIGVIDQQLIKSLGI